MRRLLPIFLACIVGASSAEPLGGATGRYDNDLGQIIGFSKSFRLVENLCNELFPDLSAKTSAAVENWEERNGKTLQEINIKWQEHIDTLAGQDKERRLQVLAYFEKESRENEAAFRSMFTKLPTSRARQTCSDLPSNLAPGIRDLEIAMKWQLDTVRKSPAARKN